MSADVLRRAAALMRERAEAAIRGDDWKRGIAKLGRLTPKGQHMDGWHPAVALAVADWLDSTASTLAHVMDDLAAIESPAAIEQLVGYDFIEALTVARTYLGEPE